MSSNSTSLATSDRTIAARLTAAQRGAIGVVGVAGPAALEAVESLFRPYGAGSILDDAPGSLRVGRIGTGAGDEVVVARRHQPQSLEIHCHGGHAATGLVLASLRAMGIEIVEPREWLNATIGCSIERDALWDLAHAPTARTADILLSQYHGALARALFKIMAMCNRVTYASRVERLMRALDGLIARGRVGARLLRGWEVVLVGRPNVGKSRLLNALSGYERAIVDPTPGTTRDLVCARVALEGWPVELVDTAGMREAAGGLEREGMRLAAERQRAADLVLLVLDRSEPLGAMDRALIQRHPSALVVANKADLAPAWNARDAGAIELSAATGRGIDSLASAIANRLIPRPPIASRALPFRQAQVRRLRLARRLVELGRSRDATRVLARMIGTVNYPSASLG